MVLVATKRESQIGFNSFPRKRRVKHFFRWKSDTWKVKKKEKGGENVREKKTEKEEKGRTQKRRRV